MAFTKPVRRAMWHLDRRLRAYKRAVTQHLANLDATIAENGGEADAEIVAGWTAPEFLAGFKALRDALKNFPA